MAELSIHEPKKVVDVVPATFDFTADLLPAETISTAVATVSVHTGTDPTPSAMLYQVVTITGNVCEQKVQQGLPGVVYDVLMTIVTSTARTIEQVTRIAILPDAKPAVPVYIPLYFTSQPYPIDITDSFTAGISILGGHSLYNPYTTEWIGAQISMLNGNLYAGLISYAIPADGMQAGISIQNGNMYEGLVSYDNPAEGILGTITMKDGNLYSGLVHYNIFAEGVQAAITILDGSLT